MTERVAIFDENYNKIGEALRDEVHAHGSWHEVFHCWVIENRNNEWLIYLQLRSEHKKDYPSQFDISAAGHILATETMLDGVRELKEELGINVSFEQLKPLGVIPYTIENQFIKDNEFAHVFVYKIVNGLEKFQIQREELDRMYYMRLTDFIELVKGGLEAATVKGYCYQGDKKVSDSLDITLDDMQALPLIYLKPFIEKLQALLK